MKTTINFYQFNDTFKKIRPDNFSYEGLKALYDYLVEYENSTGEELEFDVIGLCVDFTEYESVKDFLSDYHDYKEITDEEEEEEEKKEALMEALRDETQVIDIPDTDGFIVGAF